jgi:exopolysaccharide biosynthesis protein
LIGPLIDCGNISDNDILLDGGCSSQFNCFEDEPYLILDGGQSMPFSVNGKKINLGNSQNTICN